ncbi:MAG: hypothetical protein C4329_14470 [Chitinophagaceae bacterium]
MRKVFLSALALVLAGAAMAQTNTTSVTSPNTPSVRVSSLPRGNDHIMLQLGYLSWTGKPDSINTGGLPRTFNMYVMFAFPFKTNPHFSSAIGLGFGSDNMYFDNTYVDLKSTAAKLPFSNVADTNHYKKFKVNTAYLEVPVELRFTSNPDDDSKSIKAAIGVKAGLLLSAHSKGKDLQNKNGTIINSYTEKESSKRFFNSNRLSVTARVGIGHFSLFGSYAVTPLLKDGVGPVIRPMTIGLNVSGL